MGSICNLTFIATHFGIVATFQPPTAPYPLYLNVLFVKIRKSRDKGKTRESCNLIEQFFDTRPTLLNVFTNYFDSSLR